MMRQAAVLMGVPLPEAPDPLSGRGLLGNLTGDDMCKAAWCGKWDNKLVRRETVTAERVMSDYVTATESSGPWTQHQVQHSSTLLLLSHDAAGV